MHHRHIACLTMVLALLALETANSQGNEANLRVMTFNIRYATAQDGNNAWDKRKDLLLETIGQFHPDLLGTQEVLAVQADFLAEHLKDYALIGVGRDDGKRQGEFSALLYKTRRFDVIDSGTFWLSETPEKAGSKSWDSSLPRIATWAKLRDRVEGGREILFLNTHWDHRGQRAQTESGRIIRGWLADHSGDLPTIVTGDLNVTESHGGLRALLDVMAPGPKLRDAFRLLHPLHLQSQAEEATFHNFAGGRNGRRIDFILASPEFTPLEAAIDYTNRDGRYPSDHYPVTAVFSIGPSSAE